MTNSAVRVGFGGGVRGWGWLRVGGGCGGRHVDC